MSQAPSEHNTSLEIDRLRSHIALRDQVIKTYQTRAEGKPIEMVLDCPGCHRRHIDKDEWTTRPHRKHLCEHCGYLWRPALIDTVGVQSLPEGPRIE